MKAHTITPIDLPSELQGSSTVLILALESLDLTHLLSFLLELFNRSLVNTTALVNQMTSGGGLSRVDVSNDDDVDVGLFLRHVDGSGIVGVEEAKVSRCS